MSFLSCEQKQSFLCQEFEGISESSKYQKIIEMGRVQPKINSSFKTAENLVAGCQSIVYLHSFLQGDLVVFQSESDALISAGLAALLIRVYSHETPETILKCPPSFIERLGITASLTPNRANGLYSIHLKMKKDALKFFMELSK